MFFCVSRLIPFPIVEDLDYGMETEKRGKLDTNSVGPGVRQETLKKVEKEKFSVFLAIFQVIQCLCLIFHIFQFSCHNSGPRTWSEARNTEKGEK